MKRIFTQLYREHLPIQWQHKLDLVRGQSRVFWPHFVESKSLFIHIPKAGGSSIGKALYGRNVGHRKALEYYQLSPKHFSSLYSFAFTRNPWDRCVSAFHFAKQGGTSVVDVPNKYKYQSDDFETFETFVTQWLVKTDLSKEDVIFQPQHWFVCDSKAHIIVNFVGKLECLDDDVAIIQKALAREIVVPKINQSTRSNQSYREYFNQNTKDIVSKIYQKDIDLFGYEF